MTDAQRALAALRGRPFAHQITLIADWISAPDPDGGRAVGLLDALTALRDHEPLAVALRQLALGGGLSAEPSRSVVIQALPERLAALPDSGLDRALAALGPDWPQSARAALIEGAERTLRRLRASPQAVERLLGICLLARWLVRQAPERWAAQTARASAVIHEALTEGPEAVAALPDGVLMALTGAEMVALERRGDPEATQQAWQARRARFALAALEQLEATPRSLSQAGAEALLSRRIYTDPVHFLFELLQNAEDARARCWRLRITADEIRLWHNGLPFDVRDVVGVLSIGQSTKGADQIGTFGVGFKAVHAVSERPRLSSDVWAFEVADVSIPRPLGPEGDPWPGAPGTLLTLPLRTPDDPRAGAEAIAARARALPVATLLTLSHVERIEVESPGAPHRVITRAEAADGEVALSAPEGQSRWRVAEGDDPALDVRVAVALDAEGLATPMPRTAATVFCGLPTGARPGIRVLVHARFVLPVDRERLDPEVPTNRLALEAAGRALARLTSEAALRSPAAAEAMLTVAPLPNDLTEPGWSPMARAWARAVRSMRVLTDAIGQARAPAEVLSLPTSALASALVGVPLDDTGRVGLWSDRARVLEALQALGVPEATPESLARAWICATAGGQPGDPPPTRWVLEAWPALAPVLAEAAAQTPEAEWLKALGAANALPDREGRLWPAGRLAMGEAAACALYQAAGRPRLSESLVGPQARAHRHLWAALGVVELKPETVAEALLAPEGEALARAEDGAPLRRWLTTHQPALSAPTRRRLARASRWLDDRGHLRALVGPEALMLPEGPLAEAWTALRHRPPLLSGAATGRSALAALGAEPLTLTRALEALQAGRLTLEADELMGLHRHLAQRLEALTQGEGAALAQAPLWPDLEGRRRALVGAGPALLPGWPELASTLTSAPWLAAELAALPHPAALGARVVGAGAVISALVGEPGAPALWSESLSAAHVTGVFEALIAAPSQIQALSRGQVQALVGAPCWPDEAGRLRPLSALAQPPQTAELVALRSALEAEESAEIAWPLASPAAQALARALGVLDRLAPADAGALIAVLPVALEGLDAEHPIAQAAHQVLNHLATEGLAQLEALAEAPIFLTEAGVRRPLGRWASALPDPGAHRAGALRAALTGGPTPLLHPAEEAALAPALEALGLATPGLVDLVHQAGQPDAERAPALRAVVLADAEAIQALPPLSAARLARLPIWPAVDGALRPAEALVRAEALALALGLEGADAHEVEAAVASVAAPEACLAAGIATDPAAEAALESVRFASAVALLLGQVRAAVRPGEPLAAQPLWLSTPERLLALLGALRVARPDAEPEDWPLAVNLEGAVVAGPVLRADAESRLLARGDGLVTRLADPDWAAQAEGLWPKWAPALRPARLLAALAGQCEAPCPVEASLCEALHTEAGRQALYRWLQAHLKTLLADPDDLGRLGAACFIRAGDGQLRAARELVLDPGVAAGLDALDAEAPESLAALRPHPEVPAALVRALGRGLRRASRQRRRIIDALLEAHEALVQAHEPERSPALVELLARALGADDLDDAGLVDEARRCKVHRRLRVLDHTGAFTRPKALLAPDSVDHQRRLEVFAARPPARVDARYDGARTRRLLQAAGAGSDLGPEAIGALLDGLDDPEVVRPGLAARVALAGWLMARVALEPRLVNRLRLNERPWLSDGIGQRRPPAALLWPTPEVEALLGAGAEAASVHPAVARTTPPEAREALRFRAIEAVELEAVAAPLRALGAVAPEAALAWLEARLSARRLTAAQVREALRAHLWLEDDDGEPRRPATLVRDLEPGTYGQRRWGYRAGRRRPRLSGALGIPAGPEPSVDRAFLEEVAVDHPDPSPERLAEEPGLAEAVTRALARLEAAGQPWPAPWRSAPAPQPLPTPEPRPPEPSVTPEVESPAVESPGVEEAPDGLFRTLKRWLRGSEPPVEQPAPEAPAEPTRAERRRAEAEARRAEAEARRAEAEARRAALQPMEAPPSRPMAPPQGGHGGQRQSGASTGPAPMPDDRRWFRPRAGIEAQSGGSPDWIDDRQRISTFGFRFSPGRLPAPWLYGHQLIADHFDAHSQGWTPAVLDPQWAAPVAPGEGPVIELEGLAPRGEALLPMPLYGQLVDWAPQEGPPDAVAVTSTEGAAPLVVAPDDLRIRYRVRLTPAPAFQAPALQHPVPPEALGKAARTLLALTVPDEDLPEPCHRLVDALTEAPAIERVTEIRAFIQDRYRYDPTYLEDRGVARWLDRVKRGRAHGALAALHAGRDARHLGRGVCFELNALACELMRRAGVPAAIATGWTFDRGRVDEPDHLWAMALLATEAGPRWMPVDASSTREGRPLHPRANATPPQRPRRDVDLPRAPKWARDQGRRARRGRAGVPLTELVRVARHVTQAAGQPVDDATLRARCRAILADPEKARALAALLGAPER